MDVYRFIQDYDIEKDELLMSDKCDSKVAELLMALLQPDPETRLNKVMPNNGITKIKLFEDAEKGLNFSNDDKLLNLLVVRSMKNIKSVRDEGVKE